MLLIPVLLRLFFKLFLIIFTLSFCSYFLPQPFADAGNLHSDPHSLLPYPYRKYEVSLGFVFDQFTVETQKLLEKFIQLKSASLKKNYELKILANFVNTADTFKLSRIICHQLSLGVIGMMVTVPLNSFSTFDSYTRSFNIPIVIPSAGMSWQSPDYNELALFMKPENSLAIIDVIKYYGWARIIFMYDSTEGLLVLQEIYRNKIPEREKFVIDFSYKVSNASDVINNLLPIEEENRFSHKYIILHCSIELAKETLKKHVREVNLGRRNYHYFFSNLIMDDVENSNIVNFGAINVTGFGLLDKTKQKVQDMLKVVRRTGISTATAIMCDSIEIYVNTIEYAIFALPSFIYASRKRTITGNTSIMDCNEIKPFELGQDFLKYMKKTEVDGLTGFVGFADNGQRRGFTLQIRHFNHSAKKFENMGTWQEGKGLMIHGRNVMPKKYGNIDRAKTYIITTIVEYPYLYKEELKYDPQVYKLSGLCRDLAELVMYKLELKYEMRLVRDGKYGDRNEKSLGGWDGMIGEILRKEADMVVAPLTVTPDRKEVVDFSEQFLSFLTEKKSPTKTSTSTMFTFIRPFSWTVWLAFAVSVLGFVLCLHFISYVSNMRHNIRNHTPSSGRSELNTVNDDNTRESPREGGIWVHVWFAISTMFQQGNGPLPRSIQEFVVTVAWFIFILLLLAAYTAGLSSYFTVEQINVPVHSYTLTTECTKDNYRSPIEQGEDTDAHLKFIPGVKDDDQVCELVLSSVKPGIKQFAIALPSGSPLRDSINQALQDLKQDGEIERLIRKWFLHTKFYLETRVEVKQLNLEDVGGVFAVLGAGIVSALIVTLFKYISKKFFNANIRTALSPANQVEVQVDMERIDNTPTSHGVNSIVTPPVDSTEAEEYGLPQNWDERSRPLHFRQESPSSIGDREFARMLNQVRSDARHSTFICKHRRPNAKPAAAVYELNNF